MPYDQESLLRVAVTVFNERGYDGTSMDNLAAAAGISKSSIYHHFAGKDALLKVALGRALDALFAVLDEEGARNGPAMARLEHVVRRTTEILVTDLPFVTILLRLRGNSATEVEALDRRRRFDTAVASLVDEARRDGDLRPGLDPVMTTRLVFGMINSIVEWYRPGRGLSAEEVGDSVVDLVMSGLRRSVSRPEA